MTICKKRIEFMASATTLLELSRRHNTLFVIASVKILITSKNYNSPSGKTYVIPLVWKRLTNYLRGTDVCYVDKGNFIIALADIESTENTRQFCERMIETLSDDYHFENKTYHVNLHIGLSQYRHDADEITEMIEHANTASSTIDSNLNRLEFYQ